MHTIAWSHIWTHIYICNTHKQMFLQIKDLSRTHIETLQSGSHRPGMLLVLSDSNIHHIIILPLSSSSSCACGASMALPRFNYTVASSRPSLHGFLITCSLGASPSSLPCFAFLPCPPFLSSHVSFPDQIVKRVLQKKQSAS